MFVPCPHCGFPLALTVAGDGAAQGCPRCDAALPNGGAGASGSLSATAAQPPAEAVGSAEADIEIVTATKVDGGVSTASADPVATLIAADAATPPALAAAEPATSRGDAAVPSARRRGRKPGTPSFARPSHEAAIPLGPRWPGLLVIAALLLVFATQLLLVERAALAASTHWRPVIARVCAVLLCDLPPWHQPEALAMLDRGVQPHPRLPGVLAVRASFRNDARFPQPWPKLLLSLADVDGRTVAQGLLSPREYGASADGAMLLAPGQVASVGFAVREPEPRSVAFSFEFR